MLLAGDLEGRGGHHCSGVWCEWGIGVGESLTYACAGVTQVCLMTSQSQDQGCGGAGAHVHGLISFSMPSCWAMCIQDRIVHTAVLFAAAF